MGFFLKLFQSHEVKRKIENIEVRKNSILLPNGNAICLNEIGHKENKRLNITFKAGTQESSLSAEEFSDLFNEDLSDIYSSIEADCLRRRSDIANECIKGLDKDKPFC